MDDLITLRPQGLYCAAGDFYIDPWRPVDKALLTHCHADHARWGMGQYIGAQRATPLVRARLGQVNFLGLPWRVPLEINGVRVSFHPAGHILGSSQIRLEHAGQVWVASGDYKVEADATCDAFEPVRCDTFITESTFALPIYRWPAQQLIFDQINQWWSNNRANGVTSVLYAYSLGKAQRLLRGVDASIGPIVCHGAVDALNEAYQQAGVALPHWVNVTGTHNPKDTVGALVIAPPSVKGSAWLKRFGPVSDAFVSGWMQLRGARRRRSMDRGFVLSDHADWPGLQSAIRETGAQRVIVTHGYSAILVRWLQEQGLEAREFQTEYGDETALEQEIQHVAN
jgi:putative mRNA 3-end processing factor